MVPSDGTYRITYDTSDCLPDEYNYLTVSFRVRGKKVEHRMSLNGITSTDKFSVVPEGSVTLTADSVSSDAALITGLNIRLTLNNRGTTDFGVKALELNVPGLAVPVIVDDLDAVYSSRGLVKINCRVQGVSDFPTRAAHRACSADASCS